MAERNNKLVLIDFVNHRLKRGPRVIEPISGDNLIFTGAEWYGEDRWCVNAYDKIKQQQRYFALDRIIKWIPIKYFYKKGDKLFYNPGADKSIDPRFYKGSIIFIEYDVVSVGNVWVRLKSGVDIVVGENEILPLEEVKSGKN